MKRVITFLLLVATGFLLVSCGAPLSKTLDENDIDEIDAYTNSDMWLRVEPFLDVGDMIIDLIAELEEGSIKDQNKAIQRIKDYVDDLETQIREMNECMEAIRETMGFSD